MLLGRFTVGFMFVYLAGYAFIMNSFGYTYPSEIMPTPIRAVGNATAFCTFNAITIRIALRSEEALNSLSHSSQRQTASEQHPIPTIGSIPMRPIAINIHKDVEAQRDGDLEDRSVYGQSDSKGSDAKAG